MTSKQAGFTLIELLVVIVIIGILATLATVAVSSVRVRARDAKRISDIKQIQTALELFFSDESGYPTTGAVTPGSPLTSSDGSKTYMKTVPSNPQPRTEGACASAGDYSYSQVNFGQSYSLNYCLAKEVSGLPAGTAAATPKSINNACTPDCSATCAGQNDPVCGKLCVSSPTPAVPTNISLTPASGQITVSWSAVPNATGYKVYRTGYSTATFSITAPTVSKVDTGLVNGQNYTYGVTAIVCGAESAQSTGVSIAAGPPTACTASSRTVECNVSTNNKGDFCGGGQLFCEGEANCGGANLVAAPSGCTSSNSCSCSADSLTLAWETPNDSATESGNYAATNLYIGYNNLNGNASKTAANYAPLAKYAAAKFCADLTINGFSDWYLPASAEYCAMLRSGNYCGSVSVGCVAGSGQAAASTALNGCTNAVPFVTGLSSSWNWTSTESDASNGVASHPSNGGSTPSVKNDNTNYVRCVRRF